MHEPTHGAPFARAMTADPSPYSIVTTVPDALLRHDISDEELDLLCETRRDNVREAMWAGIGSATGGLPSVIPALAAYLRGAGVMPGPDLIQIVLFFVALAASAILGWITYHRAARARALEQEIRDRTRRMDRGSWTTN